MMIVAAHLAISPLPLSYVTIYEIQNVRKCPKDGSLLQEVNLKKEKTSSATYEFQRLHLPAEGVVHDFDDTATVRKHSGIAYEDVVFPAL